MTLLKDNNYKDINVALLSLEADIKNKISGFDTSVIDKQLVEIDNRIDKINAGDNNTSAQINDIRYEREDINTKIKGNSAKIEDIEKKLSEIFSAENKVTDFNTTKDSGIYYWLDDAANKPGTDYGVLLVNKYDRGDNNSIWVNQVAYGTNNKIYFRQNINSGSWTEWKAVAFEGERNATLTVNGKTYNGSEAVDAGVQTVENGGTGQTTARGAADYFIGSLPASDGIPVDTDYFISQQVNGGPFVPAYNRRPISKLWEYIKGKISSVLGLTKDTYGGKAASAGTADTDANGNNIVNTYATKTELEKTTTKSVSLSTVTTETTKYIKLGTFHWYDSFSFGCRIGGNSFEDNVNVNILSGHSSIASVCGYYSTNSHLTQSIIVKRGEAWNSDFEIYLKIAQLTTAEVYVTIDKDYQDRINISESTTAPSGTLEEIVFNNYNGMFSSNIDAKNLSGKASMAEKASFLDEYPGAGGTHLTSGNIVPKDASEYGGMRKDVGTSSMTDSGHPGQDGHLLTMFWDNSGRYDSQFFVSNDNPPTVKARSKASGEDYGGWTDIITSNNIGSQTVAKAGNADTILDYVRGTPIKVRWGGPGIDSAEWYPAFNADGSAIEPINRTNISVGNADRTTGISYTGENDGCISAAQTSESFNNSEASWASYIICNHGNGTTYYHQMLRFPFFSDTIQLQRRVEGELKGWKNVAIIENENTWSGRQNFTTAKASSKMVIPIGAPSQLEDGCIWIER